MNKLFPILTLILLIAGCASPTPTPTAAPASVTPKAANTKAPSPSPSSTPTATPFPTGLPDATIPHGLGINLHYMFFPNSYFKLNEVDLLQQSGIGIVKDALNRINLSCNEDMVCDFSFADRLVRKMKQLGIRVLFDIATSKPPRTAEERNKFNIFAASTAKHFAGKGVLWELWGEPNGDWYWSPKSNPSEYAIMADETIAAMREADPNVIILGPNVSSLDTVFDDSSWLYMEALGELGTLTKFDAINVHLYNGSNPESQIQSLLRLRRLIDSYSPDRKIPITSTELGYTTGGEFYKRLTTLDEQTKFLPRSLLTNIAHEINLTIWYDWKDDTWGELEEYDRHFGVITGAGQPKPAYVALKTLTTTLNGYYFIRRIATASTDDYLLLFRNGDAGILAAWTTSDPHTLIMPNVASSVDSILMLGKKQSLEPGAQGLSIPLTDEPQYLILPNGIINGDGILWKPNGTFFRLNQQGHAEIPIVIENPSDQAQSFNLQARLDQTSIGAIDITLEPKQTQTIHLPITITTNPDQLDFLIQIIISSQGAHQTAWVWAQR